MFVGKKVNFAHHPEGTGFQISPSHPMRRNTAPSAPSGYEGPPPEPYHTGNSPRRSSSGRRRMSQPTYPPTNCYLAKTTRYHNATQFGGESSYVNTHRPKLDFNLVCVGVHQNQILPLMMNLNILVIQGLLPMLMMDMIQDLKHQHQNKENLCMNH